jgi:hypothetical protein
MDRTGSGSCPVVGLDINGLRYQEVPWLVNEWE